MNKEYRGDPQPQFEVYASLLQISDLAPMDLSYLRERYFPSTK